MQSPDTEHKTVVQSMLSGTSQSNGHVASSAEDLPTAKQGWSLEGGVISAGSQGIWLQSPSSAGCLIRLGAGICWCAHSVFPFPLFLLTATPCFGATAPAPQHESQVRLTQGEQVAYPGNPGVPSLVQEVSQELDVPSRERVKGRSSPSPPRGTPDTVRLE